jgi:plastocyanin
MLFNIASALLAIGSLTSLASATVMHVVTVGKDGKLAFCPESLTAASGDLVQFQFYPKVSYSWKHALTC